MNEFETKKREVLRDIYFLAGTALQRCQSFEYQLSYLLFHLSRIAPGDGFSPDDATDILESRSKKTCGQLIALLKKQTKVSDELEQMLSDALGARNFLAHRVFNERIELLATKEGRTELAREIRANMKKIEIVSKALHPVVVELAKAIDGLDLTDFQEEAKTEFIRNN